MRAIVTVLTPMARDDQPGQLWEWWWAQRANAGLVSWFQLALRAVLIQPSSAAIERFFSVIKGATSAQQAGEGEDTLETRALHCEHGEAVRGAAGRKK